ncbi:MAG: hypothetical protein CVU08_10145 [Bacteroidetes bacterium HGW-Bacteroidetes-3]|jgi:hypothetical protein|nr:MAG: hypothetical protein CVU08_10145 [Bacteroidetes bacterium HGW-Bacteroidetes-3]
MVAQLPSAKESIDKIEAYYKTVNPLNLELTYTMYKGVTGNQITESYKGSIYKNKTISSMKVLGSEVLQFSEVQLLIDNEQKTVIYKKNEHHFLEKSPLDMSSFLAYYKEASAVIKEHHLVYEMILKNISIPVPYNRIVLYINMDTYAIEKQELYLSNKVPFFDKEGKQTDDIGRMEITFQSSSNPIKDAPKLQDYVLLKPELQLVQRYANYTIIDQTNL